MKNSGNKMTLMDIEAFLRLSLLGAADSGYVHIPTNIAREILERFSVPSVSPQELEEVRVKIERAGKTPDVVERKAEPRAKPLRVFCKDWGISLMTAYRAATNGELRLVKIGSRTFVKAEDEADWAKLRPSLVPRMADAQPQTGADSGKRKTQCGIGLRKKIDLARKKSGKS